MQKLFMVLLGCTPAGRHTEQHDVFFGIGASLQALVPAMHAFWPEAAGKLHIDAWREVTRTGGYAVEVVEKPAAASINRLYFLNLGGYKPGEFEEYHYKMLAVADSKAAAIKQAKRTAFYKHTGFKGAPSHIDEQFGLDVDDLHNVAEILPAAAKERYQLLVKPAAEGLPPDELHLGYLKLPAIV